jgi:hypothetical protein
MSIDEIKASVTNIKNARKKQAEEKKQSEKIPDNAYCNFYVTPDGFVPKSLHDLLNVIKEESSIIKIGGDIFGKRENKLVPIPKPHSVMTWFHGLNKPPYFKEKMGFVKEINLFEGIIHHLDDDYDILSEITVYPKNPRVYVNCEYIEPEENGALDELLKMFNPDTEHDAVILKSLFCTVAWSEGHGKKPFFLIKAKEVNTGKSTLLEKIAEFFLGGISLDTKADHGTRVKEILTLKNNRIVYFDNVKTPNWSDPALESMITSPFIQAHRLYHGSVQIPNIYTYMATLNYPNMSEDLASRSVPIELKKPTQKKIDDWEESLDKFLVENRTKLFADIGAIITGPRFDHSFTQTRFPLWEKTILKKHKLSIPDISAFIKRSQNIVNCENSDETEDQLCDDLSNVIRGSFPQGHEQVVVEGGSEDYSWFIPTKVLYDLTSKKRGLINTGSGADGRILKKKLDKFKKWDVMPYQPWVNKKKIERGYFFLSKSKPSDQAYRILPGSHAGDMRAEGLVIPDSLWEELTLRSDKSTIR